MESFVGRSYRFRIREGSVVGAVILLLVIALVVVYLQEVQTQHELSCACGGFEGQFQLDMIMKMATPPLNCFKVSESNNSDVRGFLWSS